MPIQTVAWSTHDPGTVSLKPHHLLCQQNKTKPTQAFPNAEVMCEPTRVGKLRSVCSVHFLVPQESSASGGQAGVPDGSRAEHEILPDTWLWGVLPQKAEGSEKLFLLLIAVKTRHPTMGLRVQGWSRGWRPQRGPIATHSEGRGRNSRVGSQGKQVWGPGAGPP